MTRCDASGSGGQTRPAQGQRSARRVQAARQPSTAWGRGPHTATVMREPSAGGQRVRALAAITRAGGPARGRRRWAWRGATMGPRRGAPATVVTTGATPGRPAARSKTGPASAGEADPISIAEAISDSTANRVRMRRPIVGLMVFSLGVQERDKMDGTEEQRHACSRDTVRCVAQAASTQPWLTGLNLTRVARSPRPESSVTSRLGLGGNNVMVCPDLVDRSGGVCRASATDTSSMLHTTSFRQSGCAFTGACA